MTVNIYIYQTVKGPGIKAGSYTYILEADMNGKIVTLTKTDVLEPMTEHRAELVVLLKALKRLRKECDVVVIGSGRHIRMGIEEWMQNWIAADWKNAKGKEVANKEEWQQLSEYLDRHKITVSNQEQHTYSHWMKDETERKEKERQLCLKDSENLIRQQR